MKKLQESPKRNWVLKSLIQCGTARKPDESNEGAELKPDGVVAKRSGTPDREGRGYLSNIYRCNKAWCPICSLRLAVRRRAKLADRAKEIEGEREGDGWREWPVVVKDRKRRVKQAAKALLREVKTETGAMIKDLEPLLMDHLLEFVEVEDKKPELLHLAGALTCRHREGNDPGKKWDGLSVLWNGFQKCDGVAEVLAGYFMGAEVTWGRNGWHPHLQAGWSLVYRQGEDPVQVFHRFEKRVRTYFEDHAHEYGITVDWQDDWLQIANGSIEQLIHYVTKVEADGTVTREKVVEERLDASGPVPEAVVNEAVLGVYKRGSVDMFDAPTEAFVELAESTKGMRWFRTGGIWSSPETDKSDEELAQEDETQPDDEIVRIPSKVWNCLCQEVRHMLIAVLEDVRYGRDCVRDAWKATEAMMLNGHLDQRTIRDTLMCVIGDPGDDSSRGPREGPK